MLRFVEAEARKRQLTKLKIMYTAAHPELGDLYRRWGFAETGTYRHEEWQMDFVRMEKILN